MLLRSEICILILRQPLALFALSLARAHGSCTERLELIGALRVAAMEREETSEQQKARRAVEAVQAAAQEAKVLPGSLHNAPEPSPSLQMQSPRIQ